MIVTCQECSTSFQLDETRIPASGARVRCSRCKHAFFLPRPTASPDDAIHAVVEEAIAGESARGPSATHDLVDPPSAPARAAPASSADADEEDWQFSQDIPAADERAQQRSAPSAAKRTPRPDSFDLTGDFGRGFDPDGDPTSESGASGAAARTDAVESALSSFGEVDDFSAQIEDEHEEEIEARPAPTPAVPARVSTAPTGVRPSLAQNDGADDPESWDLLGGERAAPVVPKPAPVVRPSTRPSAPARSARPTPAPLDLFADASLPPAREEVASPSAWLGHAARLGHLAGWGMTLLCVAWVAHGLARAEWQRASERPAPVSIGPVVAETTRVGWLETSRSGLLLVVEGVARNTGGGVANAPFQLTLLDASGERLNDAPLAVGRPIQAETLREAPSEALVQARRSAVFDWQSRPLAPGEARPFAIVALQDEVPRSAQRWLLEPGPGTHP